MGIQLAEKYAAYTDEQFAAESKRDLITNQDFDWTGVHSVRIYSVGVKEMNDYDRQGTSGNVSRYGPISSLNADTQEMILQRDRSFTFVIDRLDADETQMQMEAATALARQNRIVTIPEIDSYTYEVMVDNAGTVATPEALTPDNIYGHMLTASKALDDDFVPETDRVFLVTPETYRTMKLSPEIVLNTDIGVEMRQKGVIASLDGAAVIKVPSNRLPENFGFMLAHPAATVAPVKLEDFTVHNNPPYVSGWLVEGRVAYDAFDMKNKAKAIYYHAIA